MRRPFRFALGGTAAVAALVAAGAATARGQAPDAAVRRADSLAAAGDTAGAMALLDAAVRKDVTDHAAWHRRGRLAMYSIRQVSREEARRVATWMPQKQLRATAHFSLRHAVSAAPDSARYLIDLGEYLLMDRYGDARTEVLLSFDRALDVARRVGGPAGFAGAAESIALILRREYEWAGLRPMFETPERDPADTLPTRAKDATASIRNFPVADARAREGRLEYLTADRLFCAAHREMPRETRYLRRLVGWLGEWHRWEEALRVAQRAAAAERAWLLLDPLWASPGNEYLLEYVSRVVEAWMRWDGPAPGVHPADGEHGSLLVALGPPAETEAYLSLTQSDRLFLVWLYPKAAARQPASRGTLSLSVPGLRRADREVRAVFARDRFGRSEALSGDARAPLARQRERVPILWDNVAQAQQIDSAGVHTARFRVPGADSADVYVAAHVPVGEMVRDVDLARVPLQVDLWVLDGEGRRVVRDSAFQVIAAVDSAAASVRVWRRRLPAGSYYYRVEAWQAQLLRGARGVGRAAGAENTEMKLRGFGLSDVLVAERVAPRGEMGPATRWSDFNIVPNAGRLRRGQPYALLWEVYEAARGADGLSRYHVEVTVRQQGAAAPRSFLTQVVSGVDGTVGLRGRGRDGVSIAFDRRLPASPASVNYLGLRLGDAPAGDYMVEIIVADRVSGAKAARAVPLTVVP